MASLSEDNLLCPVCHEVFQNPILVSCGHSFCKACWQRWWTGNPTQCPFCKQESRLYDPPSNLALKSLCEDFLLGNTGKPTPEPEEVCNLHSEKLKLFCLDDEQLVCVVCLRSETHSNHNIKPIAEAARDYKKVLELLLKPLQEKLDLFGDIKRNIDQTAKDVEVQAQDTERQIKDVISMLQRNLQKEEQTRTAAVREEKQQKTRLIKNKSEDLKREIDALSPTVRATEEVLKAEDLMFLKKYTNAAKSVRAVQLNDPQPIPEALINMVKHLKDLPFNVLDRIKTEVTQTQQPQPADTSPRVVSLTNTASRLRVRNRISVLEDVDSL